MSNVNWWCMCLAAVGLALAESGGAKELSDQAPPLKISQWVKGEKVDLEAGGGQRIYVVDFWATWSPPCRENIPYLSRLQELLESSGVTVVGVSSEPAQAVEPFVEKMGDRMGYAVGVDEEGRTTKAYMGAYGVRNIPHTFLINKEGKVVWHGHPKVDLAGVLSKVVSGTYDLKKARRADRVTQLADDYLFLARQGKGIDEIEADGRKALELGATRPDVLNNFAWAILTDPAIEHRDLDLALQLAKIAHEAAGGLSAVVADTYARALFAKGKVDRAVELQKEAVELAASGADRNQFEKTLQEYQEKNEN